MPMAKQDEELERLKRFNGTLEITEFGFAVRFKSELDKRA